MGRFFNPNNFLWQGFARIADFMFLSICFFLTSIPLVTIPAAAIALYDSASHCLYRNEPHPYGRFFRTFKNELRRSVGLAIFWAGLAFVLSVGYQVLFQQAQANLAKPIFVVIYYFSLLIPVGLFCWVIPVESRFVYSFLQLHKMSLYLVYRHLPTTVIITLLGLTAYELCVNMPFLLIILPAIIAYLQCFLVERVFTKYLPKEESEQPDAPDA